jgi:hypothetical protein
MTMGMDETCDTIASNTVSYTLDILLSSSPLVIKADNFAPEKIPCSTFYLCVLALKWRKARM